MKENSKTDFLSFLHFCFFVIGFSLFFIGNITIHFNIILCGLLFFYLSLLFYCFKRFKRRCILTFLYIMIWVFLLSRPTVNMFKGVIWWYYTNEEMLFGLNSIFVALVFIHLGNIVCEAILEKNGHYKNEKTPLFFPEKLGDENLNKTLRFISGAGFIVAFIFTTVVGIEKMLFVRNHSYEDIYANFSSSLPYVFSIFADFLPFFLCVFLGTLPKKSSAFVFLVFYTASKVPMFILGTRADIVLAAVFALVYFIIRDYLDGTKYWLGKFEKTAIVIACPFVLALLGAYNYIRAGTNVVDGGFFAIIIDFFYKQGVTFDISCRAYSAIPLLPGNSPKFYIFGGFIDYFTHGSIAQILFGATDLGPGNSVFKATEGHSFAHGLAYVMEPDYLAGKGCGSSFIMESYADFGYIGIAVFSFFLAFVICYMIPLFKRNRLLRIIILTALTSLFIVPRAEAIGWLTFVINIKFWLVIVFCYLFANILAVENKHKRGFKNV